MRKIFRNQPSLDSNTPCHRHLLGSSPVVVVDISVSDLTDKLIRGSVGGDDVIGPPFQHGFQVVNLTGSLVARLKADPSPSHLSHGSRHWKPKLDEIAGWKERRISKIKIRFEVPLIWPIFSWT